MLFSKTLKFFGFKYFVAKLFSKTLRYVSLETFSIFTFRSEELKFVKSRFKLNLPKDDLYFPFYFEQKICNL